jgi:D-alanine-D-alanine ligase-like ATP-grasp enzyme
MVPSVHGKEYWIIEANERPGLANHEPQPTAERFMDLLFPHTKAGLAVEGGDNGARTG